MCFPVVNQQKTRKVQWYLDTGATEHHVNDESVLKNIVMMEKSVLIKVAKSKWKKIDITIYEVLLALELELNTIGEKIINKRFHNQRR